MTVAKRMLLLVVLILGAAMFALLARSESVQFGDARGASLMFVCQNGVAMSVWSALTFNRMATASGLRTRATSRAAAATFTAIPPKMKFALLIDGFRLDGYQPRVVDTSDLEKIQRVILIDTQLPSTVLASHLSVQRWGGFPPMREYFASRTALASKVTALVASVAALERAADTVDHGSRR